MNRINEIIANNTLYNHGKNRFYLPIDMLIQLLNQILAEDITNEYIRIAPFYMNHIANRQIEFEDYTFFLEQCDDMTSEKLKEHVSSCVNKPFSLLTESEIMHAKMFNPTFQNVDGYHHAIIQYLESIHVFIPKLFQSLVENGQIDSSHICFGYFCFEVHGK
jgi:hypothetical protein